MTKDELTAKIDSLTDEIEAMETVEAAYERGFAAGVAEQKAKWNWDLYMWHLILTVSAIGVGVFIVFVLYSFIHWAFDHSSDPRSIYCTQDAAGQKYCRVTIP